MRVFLAVSCGERWARELTTALDAWKSGRTPAMPLRWTRPDTWHLTLQFLGDWPENKLSDLKSALECVSGPTGFSVEPGGLGGFPDLNNPRVLFLHMEGDGQLAQLAGRIRAVVNATWAEGPQDNRPFRGHLTLARVRGRWQDGDANMLQEIDLSHLPSVRIDGFRLVASTLRPEGPEYRELAFYPLRK
jgi:2'-5' RNA ligase